jgi:prevent-host-death family protein
MGMRQIGAFEAKTNLARLLDDVARGETIEITRYGVPVAHIVPPGRRDGTSLESTIAQIKALRQSVGSVNQQEIRAMREEGRRF